MAKKPSTNKRAQQAAGVYDQITVAGAVAFWKAQDILNAMQAIATETMAASSDPNKTADEYLASLRTVCQAALKAIESARPMEPQA